MVTGGGGSIGSELCRQLAEFNPAVLIVLDHSEFNLYQIEKELTQTHPRLTLDLYLQDVTQKERVCFLMSQCKPDLVFHAAAYKHVPLLESQICVAVNNNVLGTQVLAEAAVQAGVAKFILVSTDKAVNPSNVMGATKRVAEVFCQNYNMVQTTTQFITVRFGNVLGSAGSVVPLFKKQIAEGGPVTVTHPDMTRYFMTIPEASQLILHSSVMGEGGAIYVLDMGEPIKIMYLAEQLIKLSGKRVGEDIAITITGLRPGEKLYEELFHSAEALEATTQKKLLKAKSRMSDWAVLLQLIEEMQLAVLKNDSHTLFNLLKKAVPEGKLIHV
jgi:FlaA1/EpsC-like NDP-sugar epimerase